MQTQYVWNSRNGSRFSTQGHEKLYDQSESSTDDRTKKQQYPNRYYMGFCLFILLEMRRYSDHLKQFLRRCCVQFCIAALHIFHCTALQCDLINYNITMSMCSHSIIWCWKMRPTAPAVLCLYHTLSLNVAKLLRTKKNKIEKLRYLFVQCTEARIRMRTQTYALVEKKMLCVATKLTKKYDFQ